MEPTPQSNHAVRVELFLCGGRGGLTWFGSPPIAETHLGLDWCGIHLEYPKKDPSFVQVLVMSIYAILGVEFFMTYGENGSYTNEFGEVVELTTARDLKFGLLPQIFLQYIFLGHS